MTDLLGLTVQEAQAVLASARDERTLRITETGGYKASENMDLHTDVRVVGVRDSETEILLITAKF